MPIPCKNLLGGAVLAATLAGTMFATPTQAAVSDQDRDEARELLEQLIGYRTAKGQGQVPAMIDVLVAQLRAGGFAAEDIVRVPLEIEGEQTSGLIVRYPAAGIPAGPPVAFLAHMDVVDAIAGNWNTDPFSATEKDGYLYGRGAQDNKFGVALLVSTFIDLKQSGFAPTRDLVLAFSGDEETGMLTTREILKHPYVRDAEYALNSDAGGGSIAKDGTPLAFSMQAAEKTFATFRLHARNPGGHSSVPRPDNAIYELAHALVALQGLQFPVQFNPITRSMAEDVIAREGGEVGAALTTLLEDPANAQAIAVMQRHPQYANMLWTTCVATMLEAGHAENALPQDAIATVNCRILPDTGGVEHVQQVLADTIDNDAIGMTLGREAVESPASPIREDVTAILQAGVALNYPGITLQPSMSSGGTEGREYRRAGIPVYGAGSLALVRPDDSRAHGINERIPLASFYREMDYWNYIMRRVGGEE
ncbi:M20/M25/M40 family metallo-hydrolase [Parahaliea mediterranea]|uniref:M20/M25/M40 family metallo-hydrolase n=1 Tax=Parahaliea mediterranea TaxID=651086 RepID=UPI000E2FBE26|nr:M20/M25/M40 family metallo-hydrolase [Parahaliea mediterranea]